MRPPDVRGGPEVTSPRAAQQQVRASSDPDVATSCGEAPTISSPKPDLGHPPLSGVVVIALAPDESGRIVNDAGTRTYVALLRVQPGLAVVVDIGRARSVPAGVAASLATFGGSATSITVAGGDGRAVAALIADIESCRGRLRGES